MRRAAPAVAALVLLAGCGGGGEKKSTTTATQPARTTPKQATTGPQYVPSARHKQRPPGSVYNDEIGENVVTASRDRITQLFGPPASTKGNCLRYRIVKQPKRQWEFCFKGQRMTGAGVVPAP